MGLSRPPKRRKLAPPSANDAPAKPLPAPAHVPPAPCVSCHRALKATQGLLTCARCAAPTCAICARTCTACPSSLPPTPFLTRSPTPTPAPTLPPAPSPRRPALALALHPTDTPRGEKRRKGAEEDEDPQAGVLRALAEFDLVPGCGRTVCRRCCVEDRESASTACYDCLECDATAGFGFGL